MAKSSRRRFLKQTSASVAGMATLTWPSFVSGAETRPRKETPAHRSLVIPGVHGYPDQQSVAAGQIASFLISSTVPYRLSVCRLGLKVDDPAGDQVLHEFPESQPTPQPIHHGSCVHIERNISKALRGLTLECWVRPWKTDVWAGLLSQYDYNQSCGFGLFLKPDSGVAFYLGEGNAFDRQWLHSGGEGRIKPGRWHHLAAAWDGQRKIIWLDGREILNVESRPGNGVVKAGTSPLRLAAYGEKGMASYFLDGDLAMPVIYDRALAGDEIQERLQQLGLKPAQGKGVLACWKLAEERGDRVTDYSGQGRHGLIINHATWMIGGPAFQAEVSRFGDYMPKEDPQRGHGLRFASDDLYDCGWEVTHRYRLPPGAKPGIYVGRVHYEIGGKAHLYHITFIVRKPERRKKAPLLVLTATNTWRAYSGTPFPAPRPQLKQVWGTGGIANSPGDPPAFNLYRNHAAGQGTYQVGLRMPWPAAGPYVLYGGPTDYSHLMRADRFAHVWLEQAGYDYDVITDLDLHRNPGIPGGYRVLFINGHSEYWSIPMYAGLEKFLKHGGNVVCLSGNSLFWRVSFNPENTVMECRKVDAPGEQLPPSRRGECWHSHDGRRGGLLRECGYPGWKLTGLETLGWNNQSNPEQFGPYLVEQADHFLFNRPELSGLKNGEAIGQAPDGALPRANGHEIDVRLSTLLALQERPAPPGARLPADPAGMTRLANGIITWKKGGSAFDYFFRAVKPKSDQGGELIYWERPEGGRVFNAGSIGAGWALLADPKFQRLLKNVLWHFDVRV